jgi:hypothetical protein
MAKPKTKTAIYHPPKAGMPYLVVTITPEGISTLAASSKGEARALALKITQEAHLQEGKNPKN